MREKTVTACLSFFLGIFGIHRFYLGQYERGAMHILAPMVFLLLGLWIAELAGAPGLWNIARQIFEGWDFSDGNLDLSGANKLPLGLLIIPLAIPFFDTVWFAAMSKEKFNTRYNKKQVSWLGEILTSLGYILLSGLVVYWLYEKFLVEHKKSVGDSVDFTMSVEDFTGDFNDHEDRADSLYFGKIVQLTGGTVTGESRGSGDDRRMIMLQGVSDWTVLCDFDSTQEAAVEAVGMNQVIEVKCRVEESTNYEIRLEDCLLLSVSPAPPDTAVVDTIAY